MANLAYIRGSLTAPEDWGHYGVKITLIGESSRGQHPILDSGRKGATAPGMIARVGVRGAGMHRLSACARQLDTPRTRGRCVHLLSLPIKVEFGLIVPIRRTRSSRAARALFSQQSHWKLEA